MACGRYFVSLLFISGLTAISSRAEWVYQNGKTVPSRSGQVQVFGRPKQAAEEAAPPSVESETPAENEPTNDPNDTASGYAKMLRADAERLKREDDTETEKKFESVRERMRTHQVAEAGDSDDEEEAAPAKPKKATRRPPPKKAVPVKRAAPAAKPAARVAPAMETETITPQRPVKGMSEVPPPPPAVGLGRDGGDINPAFPYTHLLPSPFNLPQGSWSVGTNVAYGVVDFLQVSTNVWRDVSKNWNIQAKVPLVEYPTFVATAWVDYESYNPHHIAPDNPDFHLNRWQPGLVTGFEVDSNMAVFVGGNFNFGQDPVPVQTTSGYLHGGQMNAEWSWLYNPSRSRLGDNAISVGVNYDTTYSMFGFGLTHHWRSFELGVHYTFADRNRFLPIVGFSTTF